MQVLRPSHSKFSKIIGASVALVMACAGELSANPTGHFREARPERAGAQSASHIQARARTARSKSGKAPRRHEIVVAKHSYFFVGGTYVGDAAPDRVRSPNLDGVAAPRVMHGQMYVEKLTPSRPIQPYPIILIHGGSLTATGWMGTPDGREGWAQFFVGQGYVVSREQSVP
ncbi:MAG: hypothetical protein WDN44_00185 [Sphingomonas sp.]